CVALIVVLTLLAIFFRQKHPYVFVGWFWYLILLAPVLGIVQAGLQARADRFTYLPHIGITMLLTWTCADLTQRWRNRQIILASATTCVPPRSCMHVRRLRIFRSMSRCITISASCWFKMGMSAPGLSSGKLVCN